MKYEKGDWQVRRNCCTSGTCAHCNGARIRPLQTIQAAGYSEAYAKFVAKNWQSYKAVAEPMRAAQ